MRVILIGTVLMLAPPILIAQTPSDDAPVTRIAEVRGENLADVSATNDDILYDAWLNEVRESVGKTIGEFNSGFDPRRQSSTEDANPLPDHLYIVLRVQGSGYSMRHGGRGGYRVGGSQEVPMRLERDDDPSELVERYRERLLSDNPNCSISGSPGHAWPGIWVSGPSVTITGRGPYVGDFGPVYGGVGTEELEDAAGPFLDDRSGQIFYDADLQEQIQAEFCQ